MALHVLVTELRHGSAFIRNWLASLAACLARLKAVLTGGGGGLVLHFVLSLLPTLDRRTHVINDGLNIRLGGEVAKQASPTFNLIQNER